MVKLVKNIFVYGTLKKGKRNHKYFKDSIISVREGYIHASLYHLVDYDCPTILEGNDKIYGQFLEYNDPTDEIEKEIDYLEGNFGDNQELIYSKEKVKVYFENSNEISQVYMLQNHYNLKKIKLKNKWK